MGRRHGPGGRGAPDEAGAGAISRSLHHHSRDRPPRHHRHGAQDPRVQGRVRPQGAHDVPCWLQPAGSRRRPSLLPDLPGVHRPRHPDHLQRRHRGTALPVEVPGRDALRPGLLRLPRAAHRDASRRRAVGGARGEAHAQVAEPLLHAQRIRAQALPRGDHQVRQHARRRQGDVRGLLPDGVEPRAHLHRHARRPVPRPRVAEVPPRERPAGVQARRTSLQTVSES